MIVLKKKPHIRSYLLKKINFINNVDKLTFFRILKKVDSLNKEDALSFLTQIKNLNYLKDDGKTSLIDLVKKTNQLNLEEIEEIYKIINSIKFVNEEKRLKIEENSKKVFYNLKKINPTTPGQRWKVIINTIGLSKSKPEKILTYGFNSTGGRNNSGRITAPRIGGRHKRKLRIIDFWRNKNDVDGIVKSIEYNPFSSANIALIYYVDGVKSYIICPNGLTIGSKVISSDSEISIDLGNCLLLKNIPVGTEIHNIELKPGSGAKICRSAGTFAKVVAKQDKYVTIELPSKEQRLILSTCKATIGRVSNIFHRDIKKGKAGANRWLGLRPRVRGVAMNPVDHPMGGGEGKASGGHPRSRKGLCAKGKKTRNKKKYSNSIITKKRNG
jgi:large subunit ribosomal protein L2